MVELFNVFNVTNILGTTPLNYSGFANTLVRDSNDPPAPATCVVGVRHADPHRGRCVRVGRPVRPATRRPRVVLKRDMDRSGESRTAGLGLWPAIALVIGHTIGIGIFLTPAELLGTVASPGLTIGVWVVCGGLVLAGAFTFGELASRYPHAGGLYVYLREGWGERIAFLYGWQSLLIMDPGVAAALASGMSEYAIVLWPSAHVAGRLLPIVIIWVLALSEHRRPDAQHARARRDDRRQVPGVRGGGRRGVRGESRQLVAFRSLLRAAVGHRSTG